MDRRSKFGLLFLLFFWAFIVFSLAGQSSKRGMIVVAGATAQARFSHTATLLRNNKVLIAGGMERNGVWLNSAELFDVDTGRFSTIAPMSAPRAGATATLLPNGKVLIAGGTTSAGKSLATAELFDPDTNTFIPTGSMNTPRSHAVAVPLQDGTVLIAGGGTAGDDRRTASAELYDPTIGRFIPAASMNIPRSYAGSVRLDDGKVLVIGGMSTGQFPNPEIEATSELYDPATGKFSRTGSMAAPRYKHGVALLADGRALVAGGQNNSAFSLASTEIYDSRAGRFIPGPEMEFKRFKLSQGVVALRDGRILLAGGAEQPEIYDSRSDTFAAVSGPRLDGFLFSSATLLSDGRVLLVDGYGRHPLEGAVRQAWIYQP